MYTQESPSIINMIGLDTSHVIQGNLFRTSTFVESLKETNKLKQNNRKSKAAEYTIFEELELLQQYFSGNAQCFPLTTN